MQTLPAMSTVLAALHDIRNKKQEYVMCLTIDSRRQVIACNTVFIGTLNATIAHPREIFATAIADRAASIIVAHNHPSGSALPSAADITVTKQLVDAGRILDIPVIDYIIMAKAEHFSFRKYGLVFSPPQDPRVHRERGKHHTSQMSLILDPRTSHLQ